MEEARDFGKNPLEYALAKKNVDTDIRGSNYQNPYMESGFTQEQIYRDPNISDTVQTSEELVNTGFLRAQPELDPTGAYKDTVISEQQDLVSKNLSLPEEPLYSKLRSSGLSKEESVNEVKTKFQQLVASGLTPDDAHTKVFGDGRVQWNREDMNKRLETIDKINIMSAKLGSINISMEDIVSGNLSDETKNVLTEVGEYGVQSGLFESYDIRKGVGYTSEGIPIKLNDGGIEDIIEASKYELSGGLALGILAPLMANPTTKLPATAIAIGADMAGTYWGRIADIMENEEYLARQGMEVERLSDFDLHREGAIAAVTTGALAKTFEYVASKGTHLSKKLYQSILGRDEEAAIKHISGIISVDKPTMDKRAKEYSKAMGLDYDSLTHSQRNKLILQNEITNNPSLQGYLTKVTSENPEIAGALTKSVKQRTDSLKSIGVDTTSGNIIKMFEDTKKDVSTMIGRVRGALDEMFDGTELPVEQLRFQATKIQDGLKPFKATIEERNAVSALDMLNDSIRLLQESPSMGNLFKVRTDFGSLLNKAGLFETVPAKRSAKLGTVDTPTLMDTYKAIDSHIDGIIKNTPYLSALERKRLLDMKNTSDKLYSQYSKAINTSFAKGLYSESSTSKASLDNLIKLGIEGRTQYDEIMEAMTSKNQDALELAMVKRSLDKVKIDGSYLITDTIESLSKLVPKLNNSMAKSRAESIIRAAQVFEQDPIIKAVSAHRPVSAKLKSAGLTYDPKASLLYSNWSSAYPGVQVAMVNILDSIPLVNKLSNVLPLYRTIKGSAKEINAYNSTVRAFRENINTGAGKEPLLGSFKGFIDNLGKIEGLPENTRRSIASISRQYTKIAESMEANYNESRAFMDAVEADFRMNGPMPVASDPKTIAKVRANSEMRAIQLVEQAEESMNRNISTELRYLKRLKEITSNSPEVAKLNRAISKLEGLQESSTSLYKLKDIVNSNIEYSSNLRKDIVRNRRLNPDTVKEVMENVGLKDISIDTKSDARVTVHIGKDENFSIGKDGEYLDVLTVGISKGSGNGSKAYYGIFDLAEAIGLKYTPSDSLSNINKYRVTINELMYVASRGEDANHILLGSSQKWVPKSLYNKPLTLKNAKMVLSNLTKEIDSKLPEGVKILGTSTEEDLINIVAKYHSQQNKTSNPILFGLNTARLIRNFKATGNLMLSASMLYLLLDDDYISSKLDKS